MVFAPLALAPANPAVSSGVIVCNVSADYPHPSGHVNGTVNATITVSCTGGQVQVISITEQLNDTTPNRAAPGGGNWYATSYAQSNAALTCPGTATHTYVNSGSVRITFPPGFVPGDGGTDPKSPPTAVMCTNANIVAGPVPAGETVRTDPQTGDTIITKTITATKTS